MYQTLMEKKKKKKCASYPQIPSDAISRKKNKTVNCDWEE